MKFVYVLVSSEADFLAEESLVSMYSLKTYNPMGHITLVADKDTLTSLKGNRGRLLDYVDEFVEVIPPKDYSPIQKSRFLKTSLRRLIKGDFLYLDNDTIIFGPLSDIFRLDITVGAVLDNHRTDWNKKNPHPQVIAYHHYLQPSGVSSYAITHHYNGGVIFAKDCKISHQFFSQWHELWLECTRLGFNYDQPALWYANFKMKNLVTPLDGTYNCQIPFLHSLCYLERCKILHYFSSYGEYQGFFMQDINILQRIRTYGINKEIIDLIKKSKSAYLGNLLMMKGKELNIYNSPIVVLARKLSRDYPFSNKLARMVYKLFGYKI